LGGLSSVANYDVVVSEPKTAKGRRSLALDPATVAALREHRTRQVEQRLAVGPGWQDSGLVFTWPDGRPIHPLTTGRKATSERKMVTRQSTGQRGASGGSRTPTSLRTPGPKPT
jgi:hypothetical protein